MSDLRQIREGALQPEKDPSPEPPGPKGTEPINPITGRPFPSTSPAQAVAAPLPAQTLPA
jgi:hypothetical protein